MISSHCYDSRVHPLFTFHFICVYVACQPMSSCVSVTKCVIIMFDNMACCVYISQPITLLCLSYARMPALYVNWLAVISFVC